MRAYKRKRTRSRAFKRKRNSTRQYRKKTYRKKRHPVSKLSILRVPRLVFPDRVVGKFKGTVFIS